MMCVCEGVLDKCVSGLSACFFVFVC